MPPRSTPTAWWANPISRSKSTAAIARYGLNITDVQDVITVAIGGAPSPPPSRAGNASPCACAIRASCGTTRTPSGACWCPRRTARRSPWARVAEIRFTRGPQMIRSEDTFLTAYITFGPLPGLAEVEVVEQVRDFLQRQGRRRRTRGAAGRQLALRGQLRTPAARRADPGHHPAGLPAADLPDPLLPVPNRWPPPSSFSAASPWPGPAGSS
jgi:hypothetical protein